jgi:nucleotide-binding universal stress UspA family protein
MVEIRQILCPIDFSHASRHALDHAVAIATWYQSEILALHVINLAVTPEPRILPARFPVSTLRVDDERQLMEEELRSWLEPANRAGLRITLLVDEGNPAPRILDRVSSVQADFIVMGTHGLSGFEHFMLGSVAEKVLRRATCPVMTVPPAAVTAARVPYTRLLCAVDFSESSLAALRFAFSIAKESDANLTILHVFEWPPDDETLLARFDAAEFRQFVQVQARTRLEALIPDDVRTWCKPATTIRYGKPYQQILDVAEGDGTDLIVIGVRGRNPLDLALFGSTTNHVIRRAACPVLTLRC